MRTKRTYKPVNPHLGIARAVSKAIRLGRGDDWNDYTLDLPVRVANEYLLSARRDMLTMTLQQADAYRRRARQAGLALEALRAGAIRTCA